MGTSAQVMKGALMNGVNLKRSGIIGGIGMGTIELVRFENPGFIISKSETFANPGLS